MYFIKYLELIISKHRLCMRCPACLLIPIRNEPVLKRSECFKRENKMARLAKGSRRQNPLVISVCNMSTSFVTL